MSDPPIYEQTLRERALRDAERLVRTAEHYIATHRHRRDYHPGSDPKGPPMSALLDDAEAKIKDFAAKVTAGLEDITQNAMPAVHDASTTLQRLTASPIVVELEQLASPLDPALEQAIAAIIRGAGDAADKVASMTAAATPAPPQPAPADPQVQTGIAV